MTLVDKGDLKWEAAIFGPPNTYSEGSYLKACLKIAIDYPYFPPAFLFLTKVRGPNVYEAADVCISTLHLPLDYLLPPERGAALRAAEPTQNIGPSPEHHLPPQRTQHCFHLPTWTLP